MKFKEMEPNHSFLVGNVLGLLLKAEKDYPDFGQVTMEADEDGNYQSHFYITRKSGKYKVTVEPVTEEESIEV